MSTRFPAAASSKEARENVGSRPAGLACPASPSPVAVLSFSPTLLDSQARATAAGGRLPCRTRHGPTAAAIIHSYVRAYVRACPWGRGAWLPVGSFLEPNRARRDPARAWVQGVSCHVARGAPYAYSLLGM